ncbi:MAG: hypothetical protein II592_04110, partial [Muribaculaceae bacterium]|nr:hypothetical protein [Muribaculaceae bacterium]
MALSHAMCDLIEKRIMNDVDYNKTWQSLKSHLKIELDYTKLTAAEKTSVLLSRILIIALMILLGMSVLLFLSLSLAQVLTSATGSAAVAYLIVACLLIIVVLCIIAFKKQLIIDPVARFVSKLFLSPDDND